MSNNMANTDLNLINDASLENTQYDSLDYKVYAQVLAEAITKTPTPFNLAIYGERGKGKTSLMNFLINELSLIENNKNKIINIFFDSLKFENENNPLLNLLNIIENDIQNVRMNFNNDIIINILDYIKYIKFAVSNIKNEKDNLSIEYIQDNILDENFEKHILNQSVYFQIYQLLNKLEKLLSEENYQLVIFIDNLDKCKSANIIKILEGINFIFNLKGLSFVLAANKELLEGQLGGDLKNNENYLDKIIQLPFYLPSFNGKVNNLLDNLYSKYGLNISLNQNIKNVIQSISSLDELTPRLIIKLINRIKISSKIYIKLNPNSTNEEKIYSLFSVSCILEELFNGFHKYY